MSSNSGQIYEFGPFRVDVSERLLFRGDQTVPLTPKAFELLMALVESDGRVLTKDELMKLVWPDSFVEEANLSHNIYKLREALGEASGSEKYIETLPRRGYRFVGRIITSNDHDTDLIVEEHSRTHLVIEADDTEPKIVESPPMPAPALPRAEAVSGVSLKPWIFAVTAGVVLIGLLIGLIYFWKTRPAHITSAAGLRSIAVLPFKPLVASERNESLEMGMADTLITQLSQTDQVLVRPISAVRKYADPAQDAVAAGKALSVESVLDGRIQQDGDRLRVTVSLLRVSDGTTIWTDKFDSKFTDIFAVQDSISQKVAAALSPALTGDQEKKLSKRYTANVEAYGLYLKGRFHWSTFRQADLLISVNYYNAALEKDPNYALAYAGLANSYNVMGIYGPLSAVEAGPKAREAALKALKLDDLVEAHTALGGAKIFFGWDWPAAAEELRRAKEIDPNNMDAHSLYAYYLAATGKPEDALAEQKRAKELAPEWHITNHEVLLGLFEARRYAEAIEQSLQVLKLEPDNYFAHSIIGECYTQQGKYQEAKLELDRAITAGREWHPRALTELGYLYAVTGRKDEALKIIEQLGTKPNSQTPIQVAEIYAGLGDADAAFTWLGKAYDQRSPFLWRIKVTPQFDRLRSDRRYAEILRRVNLSP